MLARTTTIQADIDKIDAGIAYVRDKVFPAVSAMSGCIGMSLLADRTSGRCIATTAWESEAAVRDSADKVLSLRAGAIEALGSDTSEVDVWEIAVVHRDHAAPDGACARVTWLSGTPDTAERAVDFYRMGVLPRLQELDGFCSASFMINREAGRAVGTATFETRQQLEASRDAARGLREAAARELGATIDDVAEMELAFAHLHIPEMV
jgi:hypothetical protein